MVESLVPVKIILGAGAGQKRTGSAKQSGSIFLLCFRHSWFHNKLCTTSHAKSLHFSLNLFVMPISGFRLLGWG